VALVATLTKAHARSPLEERLGFFANSWLLIIDELSWLPFEPNAAPLFFQLSSRRDERSSVRSAPSSVFEDELG
jgi:DNA replication protein DnaC